MIKQKEFNIPFSGLKQGKHEFDYKIENKFFESFGYDEFNDAKIDLHVVLNKMSTILELEMQAEGSVNVNCDTSGEPYDQKINGDLDLVVKFGDEFNDENDEILTIQFQRLKRLKTILEIERQFVAQLKALIIPLPAKANLPSLTLVKPIKTQTAS